MLANRVRVKVSKYLVPGTQQQIRGLFFVLLVPSIIFALFLSLSPSLDITQNRGH